MVREKIASRSYYREVVYDSEHWRILDTKRSESREILEKLKYCGVKGYAHGSLARGDVKRSSDIDIVVIDDVSLILLVWCIEKHFSWDHAEIVMATPSKTPKIYVYLTPSRDKVISKPLGKLPGVEADFYRFSGLVDLDDILKGVRVPGVNKRLLLIEPTEYGHIESSILGREPEVARILNVPIEVVEDRVSALTKRDNLGRTGIFIKAYIPREESIVDKIGELCRRNNIFRKYARWEGLC